MNSNRFGIAILFILLASASLHAQGGGPGIALPDLRCRAASFSHDGAYVVTASEDYVIRVWDARTGEKLSSFTDSTNFLDHVVFLPGDTTIIAFGQNDTVYRILRWRDSTMLHRFSVHRTMIRADVSPDGSIIAVLVTVPKRQMEFWTTHYGTYLRAISMENRHLSSFRYDYRGEKLIITSTLPPATGIVDVESGTMDTLSELGGTLYLGSISPDRARFVCGMALHAPVLFDLATRDTVASLDVGAPSRQSNKVQYSPDGKWIVGTTSPTGTSGNAFQWDAQTLQLAGTLGHPDSTGINQQFTFSADSKYIVEFAVGYPVRILPLLTPTQNVVDVSPGIDAKHRIMIAPNPGTASVTVQFDASVAGSIDIRLLDVTGRVAKVWRPTALEPGLGITSLDVHSLPAGFYLCTVTDGRGVRSSVPLIIAH